MRRKEWKKPVVAALTLAMALSGTAIAGETGSAAAESDAITVAAEGTDERQHPYRPVSGSAVVIPDTVSGDAVGLREAVVALANFDLQKAEGASKVRIQRKEIATFPDQACHYADNVLGKADPKLKYYLHDFKDQENFPMFFTLSKKTAAFYNFDEKMSSVVEEFKAKPVLSVKKANNVFLKNEKKALYTVQTGKGKSVVYTTYKLGSMTAKKSGAVYSKKGNTYLKGKKKISKKKFNKAVKKLKKLSWFKVGNFGAGSLYYDTEMLYMTKDQYVLHKEVKKSSEAEESDKAYAVRVVRYDATNKENPYQAFGSGKNGTKFRMVFGSNEKEDWEAYRTMTMDPVFFIKPLLEAFDSSKTTVSKNPNLSTATDTVYGVSYNPVDGAEADYGWEIHVDESQSIPKIKSVECMTSIGVVEDKYEFITGDAANIDGEMYEPGSIQECYADEQYVKSTGVGVRTIKVDYLGTAKEVKTTESVAFRFFSLGNFTGKVNGVETKLFGKNTSVKAEDIMKAVNPDTGKKNGMDVPIFGEPTVTDVKWTPLLK